jgi:hypothetical protein
MPFSAKAHSTARSQVRPRSLISRASYSERKRRRKKGGGKETERKR